MKFIIVFRNNQSVRVYYELFLHTACCFGYHHGISLVYGTCFVRRTVYYSPVDTHVGVAYNSHRCFGWSIFIYGGGDNRVGVSVYISLNNFGHKIYLMITKLWYNIRMTIIDGFQLFKGGHTRLKTKYSTTRVLFASTYTAKQLKTIYYSLTNS